MFLFFWLIIFIVCWFIHNISETVNEKDRKKRAIEQGRDFYINRKGQKAYVKNGVPFTYYQNYTYSKELGYHHEDLLVLEANSRKVIRNISQERRDRKELLRKSWLRQAIDRGDEYYRYDIPINYSTLEYEGYRRNSIPKAKYIYSHVTNGGRYMVYPLKHCRAMYNIETKRIDDYVKEPWYTDDDIEIIKKEIEDYNNSPDREISYRKELLTTLHEENGEHIYTDQYKELRSYWDYVMKGE